LPVLGAVPDFELTDADGTTLRRADLEGKVWLATFIFTRCQGICPAMMQVEAALQGRLPHRDDLRLVSFSVDPEYDQPKVLKEYAQLFDADRSRWKFLTGDKQRTYELVIGGFKLGLEEAAPGANDPIVHSSKMVLVDRQGQIRGYYDTLEPAAMDNLLADVNLLFGGAKGFNVRDLPAVNATLNGISGLLLIAGYIMIRRKKRTAHIICMALAVLVSALFLVSYLYYHAHAGSTKFTGEGLIRVVYFAILLSHTVLAAVVALWLVPVTLYRAARGRFERHKSVARWTLPIWIYVSVTGVLIYLMLYHWFAQP
jgi:protein SCO1/2/putative membrane protein